MGESVLLVLAFACSVFGFAWIALAMDVHWQQVFGTAKRSSGARVRLRALGVTALVVSLLLALGVDHTSIAALVWIMTLASAALLVALTLAWRPAVLSVAVSWLPAIIRGSSLPPNTDSTRR